MIIRYVHVIYYMYRHVYLHEFFLDLGVQPSFPWLLPGLGLRSPPLPDVGMPQTGMPRGKPFESCLDGISVLDSSSF